MGAGESNGVRDYKRLGEIAKLATTYKEAMEVVETQIQRLPQLGKWFVDIVYTPLLLLVSHKFSVQTGGIEFTLQNEG